ncbi:MAG: HAD family phosphatase [Cyanobacteria bacterium HKST-UBA01]|nr:HAD family phosphatase [Cyanobacteria bacterium HKST-UBA01]
MKVSISGKDSDLAAVFFDLDGTLLNSTESLKGVFREFLAIFSIEYTDSLFQSFNGSTIPQIVFSLRENFGLELEQDELICRYKRMVAESYADSSPYPGACDLLEFLKLEGITLALVTSSLNELVEPLLRKLSWQRYFEYVITGDMVQCSKPAPEPYELVLKLAGKSPQQCLAIEDSTSGVRAAVAAGLPVLSVSSDPVDCGPLVEAGSFLMLHSLSAVKDFLHGNIVADD